MRYAASLTAAFLIAYAAPAFADPPRTLTTIKPLHALAATVMDGIGEPSLLLRANASPHTYALRPSDMKALQSAQLIFWIGSHYESFMTKAVRALPKSARVIQLSKAPGVALLETREGGVWEEHDDGAAEHAHSHAHDHDDEQDMHVWLDPVNAKAVVAAMADALGHADKANAARYAANAQSAIAGIDALDAELATALAPVKDKPFIVFHDAYQYFEKRYGLTAVGSITVTPDRLPGPRRLSELRKKITDQGALCVFSEPQFTSGLVATVLEGTQARGGVLDPLGVSSPDGTGYGGLMRALADGLKSCLLGAS